MKIDRRTFVAMGALVSTGMMSGCAGSPFLTSQIWDTKNESYTETVSSLLISQDGKSLVVMTEKYHYIFDAPPELVAALKSPFHQSIVGHLGKLHIKSSGDAEIYYRLSMNEKSSQQEIEQARAAGFKETAYTIDGLCIQGELHGKRYASNGAQPPAHSPLRLNQTYMVSVEAEPSTAETAGKVLLTPITATVDGVWILGAVALGIVLFPITIPMLVIVSQGAGIPGSGH